MRLSRKTKFEMPAQLPEMTTPEAQQITPDQWPEMTPEAAPEVVLTDGQTDNIPPAEQAQVMTQSSAAQPLGLPTMTTNDRYYSKQEFQEVFASFFDFLKDPNAAADCFGTIQSKGRALASDRFYELASRYKWLNWIIDKQTAILHDAALIGIWAATEANVIVLNWTGISIFEKGQIWLKSKIKSKAEQEAKAGKRSVWAFLGRREAEKQPKQESSQSA